jgi:hypothetical protein
LPALPPLVGGEPPVVLTPPVLVDPLAPPLLAFEPPVPSCPPAAPELLEPPVPSLGGSDEHAVDNNNAVTEIRCFEYKRSFARSAGE